MPVFMKEEYRFGVTVSVELLAVLAKYSRKLDDAEQKIYGAETFKGKSLLWVEALSPSGHYVLYGNEKESWYAEYYDSWGVFIRSVKNTQAFDFRKEE
jgi:hypothetical protein